MALTMKVSLSWLKEYIDLPQNVTAEEIADKLTFAGLEVDAIEDQGKGLDKVYVGTILEKNQHPNADRLSLTKISVGDALGNKEQILSIVCGAQNIAVGQKIPVATIGAIIPNGLEIKPSKIRGEASEGMLCSPAELLIEHPEGDKGIYILDEAAEVGRPFAEYLGRNDVVFELGITPDRGDALSHIGVARDLAALFDRELKIPEPKVSEGEVGCAVEVKTEIPNHCPAYFARYVEGVKVGPSPKWLRERIESIGLRSINNVVDISSYVMFEIGQPIHTFDANTLVEDNRIKVTVRDAKEGEEFSTISHRELNLNSNDIVIAAGEKAQIAAAMAGVMGSDKTEVSDGTSNVLIESALFDAARTRLTNRNYTMLTDAAYRFERGVDPRRLEWACDRTAELIVKVAGGTIGPLVANEGALDAVSVEPKKITVPVREIKRLLGKAPEADQLRRLLERLGFVVSTATEEVLSVEVPTWRNDISIQEDVIEEVVRLWGFDKLDSRLPERFVKNSTAVTLQERQQRKIRNTLCSWGFSEALNYTFTNLEAEMLGMNAWEGSGELEGESKDALPYDDFVRLESPLGEGFNLLRRDLLPGLIRNVRLNASHRCHDVRLFEIRPVFSKVKASKKSDPRTETFTKENLRLAFIAGGDLVREDWRGAKGKVDFFHIKGSLELLLGELGKLNGIRFAKPDASPGALPYFMHPNQSGLLLQGNRVLGYVGKVHPFVLKKNDIREEIFAADIDLDWALSKEERKHKFKSFGKFPSVERDFSATVKDTIAADELRAAVRSAVKGLVKDIRFFDVYRGERIPEGHVSYAFRVVLGSVDNTLADNEIQAAQTKIIETLKNKFSADFAGL